VNKTLTVPAGSNSGIKFVMQENEFETTQRHHDHR